MIYASIVDCIGRTPLVRLQRLFPERHVIAKVEGLNPGGSVKDRVARYIIEQGLKQETIKYTSHLIESTSGNFGIALALAAKIYGLAFTAVVDPKNTRSNLHLLHQLGANIDMVQELDEQGGYLHTRIRRVHELLQLIPNGLWVNQYANPLNWQAHYYGTAEEILEDLDAPVDYLVVAVSTTGTMLGIARRLREEMPALRTVAVDALGSTIFGGPAHPRHIPGIGASRVPELLHREEIDEVIYVSDQEAIQGAHELVRAEGIFAGGSSGSVVAGLQKLLPTLPPSHRVLTLFPDRGERYLDTVYAEHWLEYLCADHII